MRFNLQTTTIAIVLVLFGLTPLFASAVDCGNGFQAISIEACGQSTQTTQSTQYSGSGSGGVNIGFLRTYSNLVLDTINGILVPVLFAVAFLVFIYGVYQYFILGASDPEKVATGRYYVLWSIIGFAVIISVWGLVAIVANTFGLDVGGGAPPPPLL